MPAGQLDEGSKTTSASEVDVLGGYVRVSMAGAECSVVGRLMVHTKLQGVE